MDKQRQVTCDAGAAAASRNQEVADTLAMPFTAAWSEVDRVAPAVTAHPRITIATTALAVAGGFAYYSRSAPFLAAMTHQGSLCNASCCV